MNLQTSCCGVVSQLSELVNQISEHDFQKPVESLNQATLGQHLRHTLEFFLCLEKGFGTGTVNYDKRSHDKLIESDKYIALAVLNRMQDFVTRHLDNVPLMLEVGYDLNSDASVSIETNYFRELVYNIEHAIHHMAMMKIGIREAAPYVQLPHDFGVAPSTIRYYSTKNSASAKA